MNMNQHIKDLIPTASDSIKVLKEFEDRYHFSRYDNLISDLGAKNQVAAVGAALNLNY